MTMLVILIYGGGEKRRPKRFKEKSEKAKSDQKNPQVIRLQLKKMSFGTSFQNIIVWLTLPKIEIP